MKRNLSSKLDDNDLIKIITTNRSVLIANNKARDYIRNQFIEGESRVKVIMPSGKNFRIVPSSNFRG